MHTATKSFKVNYGKLVLKFSITLVIKLRSVMSFKIGLFAIRLSILLIVSRVYASESRARIKCYFSKIKKSLLEFYAKLTKLGLLSLHTVKK